MTAFVPERTSTMQHHRAGNAIVYVTIIIGVALSVMAITTESAVSEMRKTKGAITRDSMESAVQATLQRRTLLVRQAMAGGVEGVVRRFDPRTTWSEDFIGRMNYGIDYIGDVPVKWTIEPMRTRQSEWIEGEPGGEVRQDAGVTIPESIPWLQNPKPDPTTPLLPGEQANDTIFLFRISAEARQSHNGQINRAQGVRYVAATKEPLFRYIIFYAAEGPKGDLELVHDGTLNANGSVHSNGAIYLGGDASVTGTWTARRSAPSVTRIGPDRDGKVVRITGFDGIYRMSKMANLASVNALPFIPKPSLPPDQWYDTAGSAEGEGTQGGHYLAPGGTSIADATWDGSVVNPFRIRGGSVFDELATIETDPLARVFNPGTALEAPIYGVNPSLGQAGNDGRDRDRSGNIWTVDALKSPPIGFARAARDRRNGGRVIGLPSIMRDRPLEAQRLAYADVDGDPTTDDHDFARPYFFVSGEPSLDLPSTGDVIEQPGTYLQYALGPGNAMRRAHVSGGTRTTDASSLTSTGHNGWDIVSSDGSTPVLADKSGLVIRERAMPDLGYMPAQGGTIDGANAVPYAYGKHNQTVRWPLHPIDVTPAAGIGLDAWPYSTSVIQDAFGTKGSGETVPGGNGSFATYSINKTNEQQVYVPGGTITARAQTGTAPVPFDRPSQGSVSTMPAGQAEPAWYRSSPGRMFHLQQMIPDPSKQGLLASFFDDRSSIASRSATFGWRGTALGADWMGPLWGPPLRTLVTRTSEGWPSSLASGPVSWSSVVDIGNAFTGSNDRWSARFVGFIMPTKSRHAFRMQADDGYRVWINYKLVGDQWKDQGYSSSILTTPMIEMNPGVWTHICIEMYDTSGDNGINILWRDESSAFSQIPLDRLCPPADTSGSAGLFERGTASTGWKSMTFRMRPGTGGTDRRLGATIRPVPRQPGVGTQAPGVPSLLDGRDPYLAFMWSPTRGMFAEYRQDKAYSQRVPVNSWFVGKNPIEPTETMGQISANPTTVTRDPDGRLTPTRILTETSQLINDGTPTSLGQGGPTYTSSPSMLLWKETTDGKTRLVPQGPLSFTVNVNRNQKWRWTKRTQWRFDLDPDLTTEQVFRWNGTDPFLIQDLNTNKALTMYQNASGSSALSWGGSTSLLMTTQTVPPGGISWNTTSSPRIIDWDTSTTTAMGRWFTVQWVSTGNEATYSYLTQDINVLNAARDAVNAANLPSQFTVYRYNAATDSLLPASLKPTASVVYDPGKDTFNRFHTARWTFTIGDASTLWWIRNGPRPTVNGITQLSSFTSEFFGGGNTLDTLADGTLVVVTNYDLNDMKNLAPNNTLSSPADASAMLTDPLIPQAGTVTDWLTANVSLFGGDLALAQQPRTFALDRTMPVYFDVNSWISQAGTWFSTYQPSVLPWNPIQWSSLIGTTSIPRTGSFRPDLWSGSTPPTRTGVNGATSTSLPTSEEGSPRWTSDQPATLPTNPQSIWMRISKTTAGTGMICEYAFTESAPTAGDWVTLKDGSGTATAVFPLPSSWSLLAMGPYMQSMNNTSSGTQTAVFDNCTVEFHDTQTVGVAANVNPKTRLDAADWDASGGSSVPDTDRYLASQYQVFFGPYDITEDFFTYRTATGSPIMSEEWIYNLREFWSQTRWWDDGAEKDANVRPLPTDGMTNRERLARQTLATVNAEALQEYLVNRSVADAVQDRMNGGIASVPSGASSSPLRDFFNGLIFVSRTNRYPANPNLMGPNPFNPLLPNDTSLASLPGASTMDEWIDKSAADKQSDWSSVRSDWISTQQTNLSSASATNSPLCVALQPFVTGNPGGVLTRAPAFRPQQWHHGVRIVNGSDLFWGFRGVTNPQFGTGKTSFVTPNPLYVQGDFNTATKTVMRNAVVTPDQIVPCALMADEMNILSNAWTDAPMKVPGLSFNPTTMAYPSTTMTDAKSSLAINAAVNTWVTAPAATSTTVSAAIVINNQPTTKQSVLIGESAAIASVVLFHENWYALPASRTFSYIGSIVCLDSKRTTTAANHGNQKPFGPTPFGHLDPGFNWANFAAVRDTDDWWNGYGAKRTNLAANAWTAPTTGSNSMAQVYGNANRTLVFNPDLLTPEGTPPFAPFGVSVSGVGGWIRSR